MQANVVHDLVFSQDPFHVTPSGQLVIRNAEGDVLGTWNGKDTSGLTVSTGVYTVVAGTVDINGAEFIYTENIDVIVDAPNNISALSIYVDPSFVQIDGSAVNLEWYRIKIYNIKGELVKNYFPTDVSSISYAWDMKTQSGDRASFGLYVAVIEYKDATTGLISRKVEKFVIKPSQ